MPYRARSTFTRIFHAAICASVGPRVTSGKLPANSTPTELLPTTCRQVGPLSIYLLSLRLAPSPWVGTRCSATAQYTVPSVSTQTMTPRRVGFFACACAPARAEPAGPSVWCTMMLRQGWAFDTSPHGASQTIFSPGMSGVPELRAIAASSGASADAGARIAMTQSAVASRRKFMESFVAHSSVLAHGQFRHRFDGGRQRRRRVIDGITVLAVLLGGVKRMVGGGH